jgi:hypothetical protein
VWLRETRHSDGELPDPERLVDRSVLVEVDPEAVMLLPRRRP